MSVQVGKAVSLNNHTMIIMAANTRDADTALFLTTMDDAFDKDAFWQHDTSRELMASIGRPAVRSSKEFYEGSCDDLETLLVDFLRHRDMVHITPLSFVRHPYFVEFENGDWDQAQILFDSLDEAITWVRENDINPL